MLQLIVNRFEAAKEQYYAALKDPSLSTDNVAYLKGVYNAWYEAVTIARAAPRI